MITWAVPLREDLVGRNRAGKRPIIPQGHHEEPVAAEEESEGVGDGCRGERRARRPAVSADLEDVDIIAVPLGHDEPIAVRGKADLGGEHRRPAERRVEFAKAVSLPLASTVNPVMMSTSPWAPPAFST